MGLMEMTRYSRSGEETIAEQLHFLQTLIDSIDSPIFFKDREGMYLGCNKAFESYLGKKKEEIVGKSVYDIAPRNLADVYCRMDNELFEKGGRQVYESALVYADGTSHDVIFNKSVYYNKEGVLCGLVGIILDISERKRAEAALRESEQRFRAIFDQSFEFIGLMTLDGTLIQANRTALDFMGIQEADILGKPFWDTPYWTHSPDLQKRVREAIKRAASGEFVRFETSHRKFDGEAYYLDFSLKPVVDESGHVVFLIPEGRDITDRKQAKEALEDSEQKLKAVVYGSPIPQFVIDRDHRVIYWNNALEATSGIKAEDIIGTKQQWKAFYKEERPCLADLLIDGKNEEISALYQGKYSKSKLVADAYEVTDFFPMMGKEGTWLYFTATAIKDSRGNFVGALETLEDVTERKRAEEALHQANASLEIKVKERTMELTGVNQELRAMNEQQIAMNDELAAMNAELIHTNEKLNSEIAERQRVEAELAGVNRKITQSYEELKTMQAYLIQSEKMAALGNLVAGVAHEINTPVGVGLMASSNLAQVTDEFLALCNGGMPPQGDLTNYLETLRESSAIIQRNLERAGKLIRSFKQVSADQSSEIQRIFNVKKYLEEILLSMNPRLKKTKHHITVDCDDEININGYPGAFAQIVSNLVMNSLTHAFSGEEEGNMHIQVRKEGEDIAFTYSDDGKGMESNVLAKIFDPFFTTKRGTGGTGLGLYIVYNIVTQQFGGSIECDSVPGQGAIFRIRLPLNNSPKENRV